MKIYVLLADRGTQSPQTGTVNLLNVGWAMTQLRRPVTPGAGAVGVPLVTGPQTVVVFLEAELAMCNRPHLLEIELVDDDGGVVSVPGPLGPQAVRLEQQIIVPSPSGVPTGFPGRASAMMELPVGLPLAPGIYRWQVKLDGRTDEDWSAHMYVAAPPQPPTFGFPPAQSSETA